MQKTDKERHRAQETFMVSGFPGTERVEIQIERDMKGGTKFCSSLEETWGS